MNHEHVLQKKQTTAGILREIDPACSIHDFRVVHGKGRTNLIFDMVIPIEYDEKTRAELPAKLTERIKSIDSRYECVITAEYNYVAKTEE